MLQNLIKICAYCQTALPDRSVKIEKKRGYSL